MSPIENKVRKEIVIKSSSAQIIQIAFLDGGDNSQVQRIKQFVNLSRSDSFVDGSIIRNIDRLGNKPRLKVNFNKPGNHRFAVKCLPLDGNASYTEGELARNVRFRYQSEPKSYTTDSNGSLILPLEDFHISAAGKDRYVFQATDSNGHTVSTGDLEVQRLIYYVELKMRSLRSCAQDLSTVDKEFAKHNIKLCKLPSVEMEYMPNIGHDEAVIFLDNASKAFRSSDAIRKNPHVVAIAYTSQLAVKKANHRILETSVVVGPGQAPVHIEINGQIPGEKLSKKYYLWQGLKQNEVWFVSARYIKDDGTLADVIQIPAKKCIAVPETAESPLVSNVVSVDVSELPKGTGAIELFVNVVDKMRGGLSFYSSNLICVCTQAWWTTVDEAVQNQIIVHELGHKIGMVAVGRGDLPDKPQTWYDEAKGHFGNHCFSGLSPNQKRYDSSDDLEKTKCVMYGTANQKSEFCINCAPVVRKLDFSNGWEPL